MENTSIIKLFTRNIALIFICGIFALSSCTKDPCKTTYTYVTYNPVFLTVQEIRQFEVIPTKKMEAFGKIWRYGDYLLINEPKKGIHVIENTNPASPHTIAFISIPGNVDMAVKNNVLYADNYTDLLVIDFSNPANPALQKRIEHAFKYPTSGDGRYSVDYVAETVTKVIEGEDCGTGGGGGNGFLNENSGSGLDSRNVADNYNGGGGGGAPSMGGSMARFTMYNNYLYILNQNTLQSFDITNASDPKSISSVNTVSGSETLFPYKDKLFMGASNGLYIYDLVNPAKPTYISKFIHANACDPVVVENDIAYVTLRNGNECNSVSNQLDIIDVKDIRNPKLVKTYPMFNPHGLGIDNGTLFICDGADGLKIFNASDIHSITDNRLGHFKNIDAFDVIPFDQLLILTSKTGIYQYDYSDPQHLRLLSKIGI